MDFLYAMSHFCLTWTSQPGAKPDFKEPFVFVFEPLYINKLKWSHFSHLNTFYINFFSSNPIFLMRTPLKVMYI